MTKICPRCHYIGEGNYGYFLGHIPSGYITITFGLIFLAINELGNKTLFSFFIGVLIILHGLHQFHSQTDGGSRCPQCKYSKMLPIDHPKSKKLIQKHDIYVPPQ